MFAVYDQVPKCLVFLLNLYMKKLPLEFAKSNSNKHSQMSPDDRRTKYAFDNDILYLRPKVTAPSDPEAPWYDEARQKHTCNNGERDVHRGRFR